MDTDELMRNPLKKFSTKELEDRIALVLSEATGRRFRASISSVDYSYNVSETKIVMNVSEKLDLSWLTGSSASSETAPETME